MNKYDLFKNDSNIIRILEIKNNEIFIINCTKKSMPKWISKSEISSYIQCTENDLLINNNINLIDFESLNPKHKKIAHERYTLISCLLPFISDNKQRNYIISNISKNNNISKQTIRNYLYLYLVYQNISILAPKQNIKEKTLTKDEKNIRWALNKFYYNKNKSSLNVVYTKMLKEKYCNEHGELLENYPSIHQFKYFYRKNKSLQEYSISRNGLKYYQRNDRPLLGDGIQEFAPVIGIGMLDSTICDIYLINETGNIIGRPILTVCIDAYSGLCCGYTLSLEGGVYSIRSLMTNIICNKVDLCKNFGIQIKKEEWNCNKLPATFVTDMGYEYKSNNFEQITELGCKIINLPPYRPELKGCVEKFFDLIQSYYKDHLKGKGVIEPDFQERGARDYRKDACLTMSDFEKILLHCIIFYNNKRIIQKFPYTEDMIKNNIKPYSSDIWNYGLLQQGSNLISVDYDTLILTLLPRTNGKFNRNGLIVNKLRYKNNLYTEMYLKGGSVLVAYNPENVSYIWLIENGNYIKFELIESRFKNKKLVDVQEIKEKQKNIINNEKENNIQAKIDLIEHIETIASSSQNCKNNGIKGIKNSRKKEQEKIHIDFMNGGTNNE